MQARHFIILALFLPILLINTTTVDATINVDVLSLTLPARALTDLNLPQLQMTDSMVVFPFYFRVYFTEVNNLNWAIEIFSNNRQIVGENVTTPDGLLRGLRGNSQVAESIPLYWQVYADDQNVQATWGTPNSVTMTVGGLAFYPSTLHYWGLVYDRSDVDRVSTWDADRDSRFVASVNRLASFPLANRNNFQSPFYMYFSGDLRGLTNPQEFRGTMTLQLESFPFDYNRGCFATPNPVKPARGQQVYFNFYTNQADTPITIRIFDPTGFPVRTVKNERYWNCRNDRGHMVEGGLYLYQIEVEGHLISGTVVVIK